MNVLTISKRKKINNLVNEINNINFLIIEGIFAREFLSTLYNQNYSHF